MTFGLILACDPWLFVEGQGWGKRVTVGFESFKFILFFEGTVRITLWQLLLVIDKYSVMTLMKLCPSSNVPLSRDMRVGHSQAVPVINPKV